MDDLIGVAGLMRRFKRFKQQTQTERFAAVQGFFCRLHLRLPEFRAEEERIRRETSPEFNIFRILGLAHYEVRTHNPFIGELLDPQGSHGQGVVFLRAFFAVARTRGLRVPDNPIESGHWRVDLARPAGKSCILDIAILCSELRFLLIIENKVWAGEQPEQLGRYREWLDAQRSGYDLRQMVFLTPTGRASESRNPGTYVRLSYQDLLDWLQLGLKEVRSTAVRETILQYAQIINAL